MHSRTDPTAIQALESLESRTLLAADYRIIDLGTLGGDTSVATAINNRGQVVGYSTTEDGETRAFIYKNGRMRAVDSGKGVESRALDISDRGHIGGFFSTKSGLARGFLLHRGDFTPLDGFDRRDRDDSVVFAVRKNGVAFGQSGDDLVVWRDRKPIALGSAAKLDRFGIDGGLGFDGDDVIVGFTEDDDDSRHTFAPKSGELIDLNDLVEDGDDWTLVRATDINDKGQIVGTGIIDGERHAFLLTPVHDHDHHDNDRDFELDFDGDAFDGRHVFDFGSFRRRVAGEKLRKFFIHNRSHDRLLIHDFDVPFGFRLVDDLPRFLDPGQRLRFRLGIDIHDVGTRFGTVIIRTDHPRARFIEIDVTGHVFEGRFGFADFDGFPSRSTDGFPSRSSGGFPSRDSGGFPADDVIVEIFDRKAHKEKFRDTFKAHGVLVR